LPTLFYTIKNIQVYSCLTLLLLAAKGIFGRELAAVGGGMGAIGEGLAYTLYIETMQQSI